MIVLAGLTSDDFARACVMADQPSDQPIPRQPGSPDAWGRGPAAPGTPGGPPAAAASTLPTLPTGFAGPASGIRILAPVTPCTTSLASPTA